MFIMFYTVTSSMSTKKAHRKPALFPRLTGPRMVIALNAIAMTVLIFHVLIDFYIGLYGPVSTDMELIQAGNAFRQAVTIGLMLVALPMAMRGSRTATACALAVVALSVLVFDGIVAIIVAPPPSAGFPYQDIAHFSAVGFGALATYSLWDQLRRQEGSIHRGYLVAALLWLLVVDKVLGVFVHFG